MTARVTQQVTQVIYTTSPPIRVSTIVVEVIRSIQSAGLPSGGTRPTLFIINT